MKKLLMIGTLCFVLVLFTGSAFADWPFKGTCHVDYIKLFWSPVRGGESGLWTYDSQPVSLPDDVPTDPCELWLTVTVANETFKVFCYAEGTQLNLALLKAFNGNETVSCDGSLELTPITLPDATCPTCQTQGFSCFIKDIDFGTPDP
jgi:hypothetical protein